MIIKDDMIIKNETVLDIEVEKYRKKRERFMRLRGHRMYRGKSKPLLRGRDDN